MAENNERDREHTRATTATVSSLKSEDSTEHLICKPKVKKIKSVKGHSVTSKSVEAGSEGGPSSAGACRRRRLLVWLGLAQVALGALLVGAGALGVARGAALARVGAGLWAGCVAVVTGVVGLLAGINDCYGLNHGANGGPLLTAFLALSLLCVACGNSAAVLAATGLQRDTQRAQPSLPSFQDEMEAWTPVLTNISLLIIAATHCLVSIVSICHVARRVCRCLRPKQPYDHNQFDPHCKPVSGAVVDQPTDRGKDLARELDAKLQGETLKKKTVKEEGPEFGSANSKEKLVTRWLGHHAQAPAPAAGPGGVPAPLPVPVAVPAAPRRRPAGVRKPRKPPPMVLVPAHPTSTLGRVPPTCVMVGPRYATLPLPPGPYAHPPPLFYPVHDTRARRRRSPRDPRERRRREGRGRERDSQLTRSLERIHRKRRAERDRLTDAELKRTYTGLDRAYAEQFIAVCDESRHAAEQHDSLASTSATSDSSHTAHS